MKVKVHEFEIGGGVVSVHGRTQWPDCLHITMDRFSAWDLVSILLSQLQRFDVNRKGENYTVSYMGKLDFDIDEDQE